MSSDVCIRKLARTDPEPIAAAFAEIGWTTKPIEQYLDYLAEQQVGTRLCLVAELDAAFAGYVTVLRTSPYEPFRDRGIPEIQDLNVLPQHRNQGIGTRLLDAIEQLAREQCNVVGIGVGLYADYGPAQRLYLRRGYLPDGRGIVCGNRVAEFGETIRLDDGATLMLTRDLAS